MATNSDRMWIPVPTNNGIIFARFPSKNYNPRQYPHEQFHVADFIEKMPIEEAFDVGCSLIVAANTAMRQYAQRIRDAKLKELNNYMSSQPADPVELAKISAMLEGINLDPAVDFNAAAQALVDKDKQEEQTTQE